MIDLNKLTAPFPATDIEWRLARSGKNDRGIWAMCLAYITNRAIMERLDEVCGTENWQNAFQPLPGGNLCGIALRIGDEWIWKWDGAENTDIEAVKGGLSGAMKRAGVQWGIGRYLYDLTEGWAVIHEGGRFQGTVKDKSGRVTDYFKWDPPELPAWALPGGPRKPEENVPTPRVPQTAPEAPRATHSHSVGPDDLGSVMFGKHKGRAWADLIAQEPDYVKWCIEKMERMNPNLRANLTKALQAKEQNRDPNTAPDGTRLDEPNDDMPF